MRLLAALALVSRSPRSRSDPPLRVVDSVDLTRYAGRWYEAARLPNKFQSHCTGDVVVHYALRADGRIDVVNSCRRRGAAVIRLAASRARPATGRATRGWRCVRAGDPVVPPGGWGDYWIIGLGPDYTWAVVGTPSREYLWILSRTPEMSASSYDRAIEIAKGNGFDVTTLVKTTNGRGLSPP